MTVEVYFTEGEVKTVKHVRMATGITCICMALAMAVSATAVSIGEPNVSDEPQTGTNVGQPAVSTAFSEDTKTYVLRLSGDSVAIYLQGQEDSPLLVTDIRVQNLRESDRALLENGITVSSYDEILQLLEDLNS
jgi:hypothetical protein